MTSKRIGRRDPRYHSRRWKNLRLQILRRDLWKCQIRGEHCRDTANQVDHILSPHPALDAASFWDPSNLRAACGPCNNGRNNPAQRVPFFSRGAPIESPLANLYTLRRFGPVSSDYSRRPTKDGDAA